MREQNQNPTHRTVRPAAPEAGRMPGGEDPRKKGRAPREKKPKSPAAIAVRRVFRFFLGLMMLGIIAGCILACYLTMYIFDMLDNGEKIEMDLDVLKLNYTTIIYAEDSATGETYELQRLSSQDGSRIWVDYEDMPQVLFDALIAVEDKRFESHNGVDWQRTFASFVNLVGQKFGFSLYEGTPGGSTITQQLVRNLTDDKDVTIQRKLREIVRALTLEKHYSKDQILETYLNLVTFGNNTYGIQAAANLYFDKDVSELTAAECASIVGITQNPTKYNPYYNTDGNNGYQNNQDRKEDILYLMHEQGKLTDAEYEEALAQEIVFNTDNNDARISTDQSYFVDYLIEQVLSDMEEQLGITYAEAEKRLYSGGYRIYCTVDQTVQDKLEEIYVNWEEYFPKVSNVDEYPESAFIITDTGGAIKGLVGGKGEKEGARVWNRATDTKRQPGSTIKPISSYALSFENELVHWSSLLLDGPYKYEIPGQPAWEPVDYYGEPKGYMILEDAIQRSTNLIPVRLVEMLTPKAVWTFLHDTLHIESLTESDQAMAPMSLGALTYGVTPMEMAGAYQMFANGGTYTEPYTYTKVLDSKGEVVLQRDITPTRVISFETATIINRLLQRVVTGPYGTGSAASLAQTNPGIPVAGKTGTTDDDVDQWFIGVTPYYVGVCWMGFDDQILMQENEDGTKTPVYDQWGNTIPHSIGYRYLPYPPPLLWKTVMASVHEGLEPKQFQYSSNVVSVTYCRMTGYAASEDCEDTAVGWYTTSNIPGPCPLHGSGMETDYYVAGDKPWLDEVYDHEDADKDKDGDEPGSEYDDEYGEYTYERPDDDD